MGRIPSTSTPAQRRLARKIVRARGRRVPATCGICGGVIDPRYQSPHPASFTVDHILALARGGSDHPANLQPAHRACNCRKGASLPTLQEAAAAVARFKATPPAVSTPPVKARVRRRPARRVRRADPPSTLLDALRNR